MDVFHTPGRLIHGGTLTLEGEESAHCARVLRKLPGEEILVADGAGTAYRSRILRVDPRSVECAILETLPGFGEPPREVCLAVALLKNTARYDLLVEKCTELGMRSLRPIITERTIPRHARVNRWRRIALAAMKQCGRSRLPEIHEPEPLSALLAAPPPGVRVMAHEGPEVRGETVVKPGETGSTVVLVGPEGGFSAAETAAAAAAGFRLAGLGERRLRTETAAIAVVTLLLAGAAPPAP